MKLRLAEEETEMTSNAYFVKRIMRIIEIKAKKWDYINGTWTRRGVNKEEREKIRTIARSTFDMFMTRIYMCVILNRNVEKNHLLRILAGLDTPEEEENEKELLEGSKLKEKVKEKLKNREEEEEIS